MQEIDPRIIIVGIEVNGQINSYDGLAVTITGEKFANENQNECTLKISNLKKETQDFIVSETSPFNNNRTPKLITVDVGRKSYGTFRLFSGNISAVSASKSKSKKNKSPNTGSGNDEKKPIKIEKTHTTADITIEIKCLTGNFQKGNIIARNHPANTQLSQIASQIAGDLGLALVFQATNKTLYNYSFSGAALKQVEKLNSAGLVNAFIDNDSLVVKDFNMPIQNRIKILNADSGMIGMPEITEEGIKVKFLMDNQTVLGGALRVESKIYPAVNGDYTIYKLGFEVASRDTPFYWIAEARQR